jgi:hypothetical protein
LPPEKILIPPDFRSKPSPILGLTARTTCSSVPARHAGINELPLESSRLRAFGRQEEAKRIKMVAPTA